MAAENLQRLAELDYLVVSEPRTLVELAAALDVSVKTVRRDMRDLRYCGSDVEFCVDNQRWKAGFAAFRRTVQRLADF